MRDSNTQHAASMMETVNLVLDNLHRSLGLADTDFFCECGHIGCKERLRLTRAEYATLQKRGQPLLVDAHSHRRSGLASVHDIWGERKRAGPTPTPVR